MTLQQKVRYDEEMLKRELKKIEILKRPKSALNVDDDDDDVFKVCRIYGILDMEFHFGLLAQIMDTRLFMQWRTISSATFK